ncbi:cell wall-binding repeat-containing protein [Ornithinimicrobium avium]|uniref:cell wall-binding repeat-containing protein n=1 Tax=Ornithinimicrobium avium TaxID=2283195 RepID=UPI0013B376EC|nr:cell wall-binding repeat-containing protein [Ornithinimicrobium avium]
MSPAETWGVWDEHPELGPVSWRILDPETGRVLGQSTHSALCGTDFDPVDMDVVSVPTPTKDEAGMWVVPDDDPTYQWLLEADGELAVRVLPALTTFPDGEVTHNYGLPADATPDPAPAIDRVQGEDRYGTAASVVLADYAPGLDTVYLASGRQFPDALAGAALAGAQDAPVLLTRPDRLPDATRSALRTLAPQHVVVLGGPAAVAEPVLEEVTALGLDTTRLFGSNRYATAAAVSAQLDPADSAFVASGLGYPDALAGAGAAGAAAAPVLLTRQDTLPAVAAAELVRHQPDTVYVLGGTTAVSDSVVDQIEALGLTVVRVGGTDRYGTAAAVAALHGEAGFPHAWVASGLGFADALSAAPLAGREDGAILLTRPGSLPQATAAALLGGSPAAVTVLGGEAAVGAEVAQAIADLAWE